MLAIRRQRRLAVATIICALVLNTLAMTPATADGTRKVDAPIPDPARTVPGPPVDPDTIADDLRNVPPPQRPNHVEALPAAAVQAFEARGYRFVENHEGLVAFDVRDESGARTRIALIDVTTDGGHDVVGMVFLDESEIAELEDRQARDAEGSLFEPRVAYGHRKDQSHYHYFYTCSWVYNQGGTYAITVYVCPGDFGSIKFAGVSVAALMGIAKKVPLLGWITGVAYWYGTDLCRDSTGGCRISMSDYRQIYGNTTQLCTLIICPLQFFFYSSTSSNFGYARRTDNGNLYYVKIPGV